MSTKTSVLSDPLVVGDPPVVPPMCNGKPVVHPDLWRRMTHRLVKLNGYTPADAQATMEAAIGYLITTGTKQVPMRSPTRPEDMGWHNFLLFTRDYLMFCKEFCGGRILCHNPSDHNADGECDQDEVDAADNP